MTTTYSKVLTPLIPREILFGNPAMDAPRISPDGTMLAYLAPHCGVQSVWIRTIAGPGESSDDRVVAHDPDRPIPWARWQGDGEHILYLQDRGGDENYHLYRAGSSGAAARDMTPGDNIRAMPLRIDPRFPGRALVTLNVRDSRLLDVHCVDFATGSSVLDTENPGDVLAWLADNALVVRAAVAQIDDGSYVIRVRANATAQWRTLDTFAFVDGKPRLVACSPDNEAIYVISAKNANASRLVRYDIATGDYAVVCEHPVHDVESVYVDPATREVVAAAVLEERLVWNSLVPSFERDLAILRGIGDGDFLIVDASADGEALLVHSQSDVRPDHYYMLIRSAGRLWPLFCTRPGLMKYKLAPMTPIAFRARDGLTLHGYLTLPDGAGRHALPAILYVHGGPWYRDRWGYEPVVQWLANRGYAVLQVNFRGSTGYGKAFLNAGNRQWAGAMRTDLLDAREWAIAEGVADPSRFAILGGSYGGYAVLTALAWTPDAFACGVDLVGPSDLRTFMSALPSYWEPMRKTLTERIGEDPAFLESQSPLFKASSIRAPLLIVQGANDPRVKKQESDQIVDALRANGIPVQYLVFDNEGHGVADPASLKRFAAFAETFLASVLGGRVEPLRQGEESDGVLR